MFGCGTGVVFNPGAAVGPEGLGLLGLGTNVVPDGGTIVFNGLGLGVLFGAGVGCRCGHDGVLQHASFGSCTIVQ